MFRLCQNRPLFDKAGDDAFNQRDLGVLKSLETPAIEFEAERLRGLVDSRLDHFEDAGLARAPVAVNSDRDGQLGSVTNEVDNRLGDRLVIKQIDLGFVVAEDHRGLVLT